MKKYILSILLLALLATPALSYGAVDNSTLLAQLGAQVLVLQRQIALLQSQQPQTCPYNKDLSYNSNGKDVVLLQDWLRASGYLNLAKSTDWFGPMTRSALMNWQRDNNFRATGMFGPEERLALCGSNDNNPSAITIKSVSGPTSISVGLTGTWQVEVTAPTNTNLTYAVDWGDNTASPQASGSSVSNVINQSSTFTHAYSQAGTYTVRFTVDNGVRCIKAPCNTGLVQTSMTVVVGGGSN
jgi:peptidoglycan hydrolase-like protein with peptidoglycan-binding domain